VVESSFWQGQVSKLRIAPLRTRTRNAFAVLSQSPGGAYVPTPHLGGEKVAATSPFDGGQINLRLLSFIARCPPEVLNDVSRVAGA
jgi:hypothetical protein